MKQVFFVILIQYSLLVFGSCNGLFEEKTRDYELTIITQKIGESNKPYPDEIVSFIIPEFSKDCGDTTFQAIVKLLRIDLEKEIEEPLIIPRNRKEDFLGAYDDPEKIRSKFKDKVRIAKPFTEPNGQLNEFRLQSIIKKYGGAENVIGYDSENLKFIVKGEGIKFYSDINHLRQDLLNRVCTSNSSKFLILYNIASDNEDLGITEDMPALPPQLDSFDSFASEIEKVLANIVQKRATTEKLKLANEVNEKYFNRQCIVKNYQSLTNPNIVDVYGSENGGLQYLRYLATDPSIIDIKVLRVEREINSNMITALYVFEKHN